MPAGQPLSRALPFPRLVLFGVDEMFGGWAKAQAEHFDEGGTFDQLTSPS